MIQRVLKNFEQPEMHIEPKRCLRLRQKAVNSQTLCTICAENCPHKAIEYTRAVSIQSEACHSCGICAALCPSNALQHPRQTLPRFDAIPKLEILSIGCSLGSDTGFSSILSQEAICGLSRDFLITAVLASKNQHVKLDCSACSDCTHGAGRAAVELTREQTKAFFAALNIPVAIEILEKSSFLVENPKPSSNENGLSRREFLNLIQGKSRSFLKDLFHEWTLASEKAQTIRGFLWTLVATRKTKLQRKYENHDAHIHSHAMPWAAFFVNKHCTACGLCVKACPGGAWRLDREGQERILQFHQKHCYNCKLCQSVCPEQAIQPVLSAYSYFDQWSSTAVSMARRKAKTCQRCKELIEQKDQRLCSNCLKQAVSLD